MQDLHPIQMDVSKSTIPSERLWSADVGQIATHGASVQWLHRMIENDRMVSGHVPFSTYFTHVRLTPSGTWCSVLHATVHAWQPMHDVWSITNP
jgi:hypothetical protein